MLETQQRITNQLNYRRIGINEGHGIIKQSKYGAFIVYSRISIVDVEEATKEQRERYGNLIPIFLLGPTPPFYGENKATTSWRRELVQYLDKQSDMTDRFMFILPEPESCDWKDVDYPGLQGIEHVHAQLHWENYFIELAASTGILVLHAHFLWKGNAGPTARFEGGKMLEMMRRDSLRACIINYPKETESAQYIDAHILDTQDLFKKDRFALTTCGPNELEPFFIQIIEMAIRLI